MRAVSIIKTVGECESKGRTGVRAEAGDSGKYEAVEGRAVRGESVVEGSVGTG